MVIKILGIEYISRKEAARRYGVSINWLRARQANHEEPLSYQLAGKGKVYYNLEKTDKWFKENMKECE